MPLPIADCAGQICRTGPSRRCPFAPRSSAKMTRTLGRTGAIAMGALPWLDGCEGGAAARKCRYRRRSGNADPGGPSVPAVVHPAANYRRKKGAQPVERKGRHGSLKSSSTRQVHGDSRAPYRPRRLGGVRSRQPGPSQIWGWLWSLQFSASGLGFAKSAAAEGGSLCRSDPHLVL